MPSKLPVIKAHTSEDNIIKMKFIAKTNKRSMGKELEYIVEKHIEEFEKEHGEISVDWMTPTEIKEDVINRLLDKPPYGDN